MKVLVTGARGFVGSNLCQTLKAIRDQKDRRERYQSLLPLTVWEYDAENSEDELDAWCAEADFVFNFAGVNRPKEQNEFMKGNYGFPSTLLGMLEKHRNTCPVMLASSVQASLEGRFSGSEYGKSKLAGENLFRDYSEQTGAKVLIYRFPNLYGKWCRPNYNSVVATFCSNVARGLPIEINDSSTELDLLYIDDLVHEMLEALLGNETHGRQGFCEAGPVDHLTVGRLAELIVSFRDARDKLLIPEQPSSSLIKKLYATYQSYIPADDIAYDLKMNIDERGSFIELFKTQNCGQVSVNVTKPGVIKGQHWHHTKWEKFVVVSGEALIRVRRIGLDSDNSPYPATEYFVSAERMQVLDMIPGYTHSIENVGGDDLVTVMWANEVFDSANPDTYFEEV